MQLENMQKLQELHSRREELHEALRPYLQKVGPMLMLNSPLVQEMFLQDGYFAWCNERYRVKKEAARDALLKKKYHTYIFLHERPYRLQAFIGTQHRLRKAEYWKLLRDVWDDSENIWQNQMTWKRLLGASQPTNTLTRDIQMRGLFMERAERAFLKKLPGTFPIFRGQTKRGHTGMSWTLDRDKAVWFARRYLRKDTFGILLEGAVHQKDVIAYLAGRNESEIVVPYDAVVGVRSSRITKVETQG